ncbi:hypothetical protein [Clostridium sp. ZBS15]|uniref:hypothetical protein n=1 Tax=Clostridium sp. ZBS15 TaxID=2949969 RepID=UPI0020799197|nr:hypothetical protein [Clostridium sp. ZBS15]
MCSLHGMLIIPISIILVLLILIALKHNSKNCEFNLELNIKGFKLFWNTGVYVDEFNTSLDVVLGGDLALIMDWIRLGILLLISILSGINIFKK